MSVENLVVHLKTIPDWRRGGRPVQYPLWLMLLTSLLGVMSGCTSLRGLADFMQRHQQQVGEYFGMSKKVLPKYSTIRRMVNQVSGQEVAQAFNRWAVQQLRVQSGEGIAIDGKALGSTFSVRGGSQDFVNVVSACIHEHGWVIGQTSFHNGQGSEIVTVRELISQLDIPGAWLTLDALHCQKKTVEEIVSSGNDYCIGLKANQPTLLKQAQDCADKQAPLSRSYSVLDPSHGRLVERQVEVFAAPKRLQEQWAKLAAFVKVERSGIREGKYFHTISWFILSQCLPAARAAQLIQGHRGTVENRLHWVKDVVQHEDASMIKTANPATLMAFLRSWALSVFRKAGHSSITRAIRLFGHDLSALFSFI